MKQDDIIRRLSLGEGFGGTVPERIDTHISTIFLVGNHAYKLKHALATSYLDYSTPADRHRLCLAELEINRRTAPQIYLDVVPVNRTIDDKLIVGAGPGQAVEWLVYMLRFDQHDLFDNLAEEKHLTPALMNELADEIAGFHKSAEIIEDAAASRRIKFVIDQNTRELKDKGVGLIEPTLIAQFNKSCQAAFGNTRTLMDRRGTQGYVRRCHGDLHLRNICLIDGKPTLFDAIEFSDDINCIDVLFDLAFLIMDLQHRRMDAEANIVFNRYLYRTGDIDDLALFPLYQALRAGIRAHVSAMTAATQSDFNSAEKLRQDAESYLRLGLRQFEQMTPQLVAIGGLSGSGKSTIAHAIAPRIGPAPGALVLSSDVVRKKLLGVEPLTRLTDAAYSSKIDQAVYDKLFQTAMRVLASGYGVVLDATFIDPSQRLIPKTIASRADVQFNGFWLEGSAEALSDRLSQRIGDPSDATIDVLKHQLEKDVGHVAWKRIETTRSCTENRDTILHVLTAGAISSNGRGEKV